MIAICRIGTAARRRVSMRYRAFCRAAGGSVATEYGLIAALIVVAIIVALTQVRTSLLGLPFPSLLTAFTEALS